MKKSILAAAALVLALGACASPGGEGTTTDWGANSFVNAADMGGGQWFITCSNAMSACTGRARNICPGGFDLINANSQATPVAVANQYGASSSMVQNYQMAISCKKP
jgi:hypothetical protein